MSRGVGFGYQPAEEIRPDGRARWTRTVAAEAVVMCVDLKNCEWSLSSTKSCVPNSVKPMSAGGRASVLYALRTFFRDLQ
jgi:hypothetical protein